MGRRFSNVVTTDVPVVTTTETIAATVVVPSVPGNNRRVQLSGEVDLTTGTNTTAVTTRWRRGTAITDPVVGEANPSNIVAAAGSTERMTQSAEDTPGDVANQTYILTVQQTAASANGSILYAFGMADVDF